MANYAIMRCAKVKTKGGVAASMQHNFRDRDTPNADPELTPQNEHWACNSTDSAMGRLNARLPEKHRKDAVLAVEYVFSASPEWMKAASSQDQADFFKASLAWLQDKYGSENIITATIHRDETTPHMSAMVVPITEDGRLCAKDFIGGRDKLRRDQTTFANQVKHLGLVRGEENSKADHQRVKKFYSTLRTVNNEKHAEQLVKGLKGAMDSDPKVNQDRKIAGLKLGKRAETKQEIRDRQEKSIDQAVQMFGDMATNVRHQTERADREQDRAIKAEVAAENATERLQKIEKAFGGHFGLAKAMREAQEAQKARLASRAKSRRQRRGDSGIER